MGVGRNICKMFALGEGHFEMDTAMGERVKMMMRQVRFSRLRYYLLMIIFLIIAIYIHFKPETILEYLLLDKWPLDQLLRILLVFLALILFVIAEIKRVVHLYIVTNIRVIEKVGIFRKSTVVMMIEKVQRVYSSQSVLQRLFRYGDVIVDTGEDQMILASVRYPSKVEGAITEAMASRHNLNS